MRDTYRKLNFYSFCLFLALNISFIALKHCSATTLRLGTAYSSSYRAAEATYSPEPEISPELQEKCFKSSCLAKFVIKANGKIDVSLLSSSGNNEVDEIALNTLRRWKFKPAILDGEAVDSTRKIKVEFEVE